MIFVDEFRCSIYVAGFLFEFNFDKKIVYAAPYSFGPLRRYLVDLASSHMLVSKIKPCMSQYKLLHSETANGSLNHT